MTSTPCRRDLLLLAAAGVAAAPAFTLTSTRAQTPSPITVPLEHALSALDAAMESLRAATPDIERAMRAIVDAMGEVHAAGDFASRHGCGGD